MKSPKYLLVSRLSNLFFLWVQRFVRISFGKSVNFSYVTINAILSDYIVYHNVSQNRFNNKLVALILLWGRPLIT